MLWVKNVNFYFTLSSIQMSNFFQCWKICSINLCDLKNNLFLQHNSVRHWIYCRHIYKKNISTSYYTVIHWSTCLPMWYFSPCSMVHIKLTTTIYYLMYCVINGIAHILISHRFLLNEVYLPYHNIVIES